jgi:hypothetical protein
MDFVYEYRFWLVIVTIAILQLMPVRWSRWSAALVCALVFVHEGQVFAFFAALLIGMWSARMEDRRDPA